MQLQKNYNSSKPNRLYLYQTYLRKILLTLTLGHFLLAVSLVGILGGDRGYMGLLSAAPAFSL